MPAEDALPIFIMFFAMPVTIIGMGVWMIYTMNKMKLEAKARLGKNEKWVEDVSVRLDKIERRLANLETIIVETEKKKEFERL